LEGFILGESVPCYLKLDQVVEFLEITKNHDPELLTPVPLNLFCGIRPSEVARMTQANISFADREIELEGKKPRHVAGGLWTSATTASSGSNSGARCLCPTLIIGGTP